MKQGIKDVNLFREKFLQGKISNTKITEETGLSKSAVGHHTTKWVKEYVNKVKDELNIVPDIDTKDFNYVESIQKHMQAISAITIEDCKNMSISDLHKIVNNIDTAWNKELNKPSLL
jgi:hypothetical protein